VSQWVSYTRGCIFLGLVGLNPFEECLLQFATYIPSSRLFVLVNSIFIFLKRISIFLGFLKGSFLGYLVSFSFSFHYCLFLLILYPFFFFSHCVSIHLAACEGHWCIFFPLRHYLLLSLICCLSSLFSPYFSLLFIYLCLSLIFCPRNFTQIQV
jgi:hypothetical protein